MELHIGAQGATGRATRAAKDAGPAYGRDLAPVVVGIAFAQCLPAALGVEHGGVLLGMMAGLSAVA